MTTTSPARTTERAPLRRLLAFPDPVNEVSARLVAGGVVLLALATLLTANRWLAAALAYGFLARVLAGPTLSPLGQLVTRVVTPALGAAERPVPGPPKRFAQGIGLAFSGSSLGLLLTGETGAARMVLAALIGAATLESVFALCLGCKAFALLMRAGVIPAEVCERCSTVGAR